MFSTLIKMSDDYAVPHEKKKKYKKRYKKGGHRRVGKIEREI